MLADGGRGILLQCALVLLWPNMHHHFTIIVPMTITAIFREIAAEVQIYPYTTAGTCIKNGNISSWYLILLYGATDRRCIPSCSSAIKSLVQIHVVSPLSFGMYLAPRPAECWLTRAEILDLIQTLEGTDAGAMSCDQVQKLQSNDVASKQMGLQIS